MNDYSVANLLGNRTINNKQEMIDEYDDREVDYVKSFSEIFQESYGTAGNVSLESTYDFDNEIERNLIGIEREAGIDDRFELEWMNKSISSITDEINDKNLKNIITYNTPVESDIIFNFKPDDFLKGILEVNDYSKLFFSKKNIKAIDDTIRYKINKMTRGEHISSQINNELFVIMRSIYLQYSKNIVKNDVVAEVKYLNGIVIENTIHKIKNEIDARLQYLGDIDPSNSNPFMNRPTDTSSAWRNYTYDFTTLI